MKSELTNSLEFHFQARNHNEFCGRSIRRSSLGLLLGRERVKSKKDSPPLLCGPYVSPVSLMGCLFMAL